MTKRKLIKAMMDIRNGIKRFGALKECSAREWHTYDGTDNSECHAYAGARMDTEADEEFAKISNIMLNIINECGDEEAKDEGI